MTTVTDPGAPAGAPAPPTAGRQHWLLRLPIVSHLRISVGLQRGMLLAGVVICAVMIVCALFAPLIAPFGYDQLGTDDGRFPTQSPPSAAHLWGTTVAGYDVFSRVIWGTRTALLVIVVAVLASIFIGVILGLISGFIGGWLDRILVVIADAVYAFPSLLFAIVLSIVISGGSSSAWGGILAAGLSITVVFIPQYFRVIRAETVRLKAEPFVEAAAVIGTPKHRIIGRHIFRNATRTLPLIFTLNSAEAILTLAGLGFLGFGIEPTSAAEWGYDLNKALTDTSAGIWWTGVFPGAAIVLCVLGITLVGESMNDLGDPRLRGRKRAQKNLRRKQRGEEVADLAAVEVPAGASEDGALAPRDADAGIAAAQHEENERKSDD